MATDPIRKIREYEHEHVYDADILHTLIEFSAFPPSPEAPYVSVSLDWRPAGEDPGRAAAPELRRSERRSAREDRGPSRRPARQEIEREFGELIAKHGPRGAAFDSLSADEARVSAFLDGELDPAAQGVYILACAAKDVFVPLVLSLPLPTRLASGPTPALGVLARLVEDFPTYAVLVADQRDAILSLITHAARDRSVVLESSDYPRKTQQGGPAQRRFQARADERVAAFARGIAEEVQHALDEAGVTTLIVAGDEVITSALDAAFHPTVKERIAAKIRLDIRATEQEVLHETLPIALQVERDRELEAVHHLEDAVGAGGRGAAGAEETLTALQAGQVATLVIADDFAAPGWADYTFPLLGVGAVPPEHPAGGDLENILPIALEEELIRLALQTGAEIQIVHSAVPVEAATSEEFPDIDAAPPRSEAAAALDQLGGVGALLRFTMDEDQPVAEM